MNRKVEVSIACATYNHEKYLRKCLDGFVKQKTNFNYEVIIHDDCSTDNSKKIIEEYKNKYPDIIIPYYEKENQYSKGVSITLDILLPKARGKYFAMCEGDDYWNDYNKLQKQYDFLEENIDYNFCVHNANVVNVNNVNIGQIAPVKEDKELKCEDFIKGGGGFISTNSIFTRTNLLRELPEYFNILRMDYILQIYLSSTGRTYCFSDKMSSYRKNVPNSWTSRMNKNKEKRIENNKKIIKVLNEINTYTNNRYNSSINEKKVSFEYENIILSRNITKFKEKKYKEFRKNLGTKTKILDNLHIYLPYVYNFLLKFYCKLLSVKK